MPAGGLRRWSLPPCGGTSVSQDRIDVILKYQGCKVANRIVRLTFKKNNRGNQEKGEPIQLSRTKRKSVAFNKMPIFFSRVLENTQWTQTFWWLQFAPVRKVYLASPPSLSLGYLPLTMARHGLIPETLTVANVLNSINKPPESSGPSSPSPLVLPLNWHAVHLQTR